METLPPSLSRDTRKSGFIVSLLRKLVKLINNKWAFIALAVLAVLTVAGISYMNLRKEPYRYSGYNQLVPEKLSSGRAGSNLSFEKPVEFKNTLKLNKDFSTLADLLMVGLSHQRSAEDSSTAIGVLTAGVLPLERPPAADYQTFINETLKLPASDTRYKGYTSTIKDFVSAGIGASYSIELGAAHNFSSSNVKNNAWQIDFSATSKDPAAKNDNSKPYTYKGQAIYIVSKKGYYYFSLSSVDYNWEKNQEFWQKVLDSLKIDQ